MRLIINPTGISSVNKIIKRIYDEKMYDKLFKEYNLNEYRKRLFNFHNLDDLLEKLYKKYEMKKANIIYPEKDNLIFLHTDTYEGELSTKFLVKVLESAKEFNFKKIITVMMPGVKAGNANSFVEGLKYLCENFETGIKIDSFDEIVFNFTGGYKGVVPVITILNRIIKKIYNKECVLCYLYEGSSEIIKYVIDGMDIDTYIKGKKIQINNGSFFRC